MAFLAIMSPTTSRLSSRIAAVLLAVFSLFLVNSCTSAVEKSKKLRANALMLVVEAATICQALDENRISEKEALSILSQISEDIDDLREDYYDLNSDEESVKEQEAIFISLLESGEATEMFALASSAYENMARYRTMIKNPELKQILNTILKN